MTINLNPALKINKNADEEIRLRIREILTSFNCETDAVIDYLLNTKGKMLRPRLVQLTASIYPHEESVLRDSAAAIELIHMASLIHDDIIDKADIRRGQPSLNSRWGNEISVLTGDFLFAAAFNLINKNGLSEVMDIVTKTIQIMCAGEIKQYKMLFNADISEEDYYDKSYAKTACLFASSCKVGALISSMPASEMLHLEKYGLCLGYAYQIIDDILDFTSDSHSQGKPTCSDLLQGNLTLPVILALQNTSVSPILKTFIKRDGIQEVHLPEIIYLLAEAEAFENSLQRAKIFLQEGLHSLNYLTPSLAVSSLRNIADYLLVEYYQQRNKYKDNTTAASHLYKHLQPLTLN